MQTIKSYKSQIKAKKLLSKDNKIELNFGEQPIRQIILKHNLKPHDLVEVSTEQITHRMVSRAQKKSRRRAEEEGR